jgi:hypothetical protein
MQCQLGPAATCGNDNFYHFDTQLLGAATEGRRGGPN